MYYASIKTCLNTLAPKKITQGLTFRLVVYICWHGVYHTDEGEKKKTVEHRQTLNVQVSGLSYLASCGAIFCGTYINLKSWGDKTALQWVHWRTKGMQKLKFLLCTKLGWCVAILLVAYQGHISEWQRRWCRAVEPKLEVVHQMKSSLEINSAFVDEVHWLLRVLQWKY